MDETAVQIPNRALFKPAEVCQLAELQPYVLRSWEAEFPDLGVTRARGAGRMYRRTDVERVLRIKRLMFVDGLTLAGIRRRMDEEAAPVGSDDIPLDELLGRHARERLAAVKQGLQGLLDLLGDGAGAPGRGTGRSATAAPRRGPGRSTASRRRPARARQAARSGKPGSRAAKRRKR